MHAGPVVGLQQRRAVAGAALTVWPDRMSLSIVGGVLQLQQCELYLSHRVPMLDAHHVVPESWWKAAGLAVASPLIDLCPDCHYAIHCAIDGLIRKLDTSCLPPRCRLLGQQALDGAAAAGLTPALTL